MKTALGQCLRKGKRKGLREKRLKRRPAIRKAELSTNSTIKHTPCVARCNALRVVIPTNPIRIKVQWTQTKTFDLLEAALQVPTEIMVAMITSGCAMIASVIGALLNYETNQRQNARDEKRDLIEKERAFIYDALLKGTAASLQANKISLIALQHGHLNGNVEEARRIVDEAQNDLEDAQRKAVAHITTA